MGEDTPREDRLGKPNDLELRVARLESLLRLLHPEVLEEEDRPPDPDESRADRKRRMRIILGGAEGASGVAALMVLLVRGLARHRRGALALTAATASIALVAGIALHGHGPLYHYAARPPRPAPTTAVIPQPVRHARRPARKPRKPPEPNPNPGQPTRPVLVSHPHPTHPRHTRPPVQRRHHRQHHPVGHPTPTPTPSPTQGPPGEPLCIELPPIVGICLGEAQSAHLHDVPHQLARP